tara:strand:+ start:47 stop:919 length:873 start_codon:yes stop_codon:yes gene_type:complete
MSLRLPRAPPSRLDLVLAAGLRALDIGAPKRSDPESGPEQPNGAQPDAAQPRVRQKPVLTETDRRIKAFQQALLRSAPNDRPGLLRVIERHVLEPASSDCRGPLKLRYDDSPYDSPSRKNLIACPSGESGENGGEVINRYPAEAEIQLYTEPGGVLSVIGISQSQFDAQHLEIFSETPDSQRNKGYNKLLRAVAVIVACVEEQSVQSAVCNWVSAYILLRNFAAQVVYKKSFFRATAGVKTFDQPLTPDEATRAAKAAHFVKVFGSDDNFLRAQRLLIEAAVLCAEAQRI